MLSRTLASVLCLGLWLVLAAGCGSSGGGGSPGTDAGPEPGDGVEPGEDDTTGPEGGSEVTSCTDECGEEGEVRCEANGMGFRACLDANDDGCLEWSDDVTACGPGQKCTDGECRDACPNQACNAVGARECKDATTAWQCADYDGDGCLEWGDAEPCEGALVCSNGFCATSCHDTCTTAGAKKCSGNDVVTCDDHDSNGCLEWGGAKSCGSLSCSGGFCAETCKDDCTTAGARHCDGNGWATCGNSDGDACLEWGTVTPCLPDESCVNGYCVTQCKDACTVEGAKKCVLDAVATCTDTNDDGCKEWTTPDPCPQGMFCNGGACEEQCQSECTAKGARKCDEAGAVIECVDPAGDGCLKWGSPVPCEPPLVCSLGECKLSCADECPQDGDRRCAQGAMNQFERCGDFDEDGCLEWGTAEACGGSLVCSGGECVESCKDECGPDGERACDGNGWHQCGDWDSDGCLEWGTTTFCKDYEECDGTSCVARPAPEEVLISEVLYDGVGTDKDSFVELWGPAGTPLAGYSLVGINGNDGKAYQEISLSGLTIGEDGFLVIAHPEAMALIRDAADLLDAKVEYQNGPDSIQVRFGQEVVDAFAYGKFAADDFPAGEGTPAAKVSAAGHSQGRDEQETDTGDNLADFHEFATPTPGAPNVVPNQPPVAQLVCPAPALVGDEVEFDATASHDADGEVTWWVFDFGDGETHEGSTGTATHTYTAAGSYIATVTVSDGAGATGKTTCNVTISTPANKPPVASLTCPSPVKAGDDAAFDASGSSDPDGTIVEYSFTFGDGAGGAGASPTAAHKYSEAGEYVVVVTVTDDDGATGTAQCNVKVTPAGAPDKTISSSQELCGYNEFGKLVIQGGATVTCATGEIDIRATEVLIDPASKIDVRTTSSSYSGGNGQHCPGGSCTCSPAYTGGAGGGNATKGSDSPSTQGSSRDWVGYCAGSCVGFGCSGATGGAQRGLASELDAPLGGAGGSGCASGFYSCSTPVAGGKGGGSVRILATKSIAVQGSILADGADGTDGYNGGSGGGAGGSIVLAAPSLTLTGTLSADGGAGSTGGTPSVWSGKANGGAGGMGWVKLCHGPTYTNTASISASVIKVESVMPPLGVTSTTHPDPGLVYNDTFTEFAASWAAPFAGVSGYWYSLNQGASFALTPANGTYTTDTAVSFPASVFDKAGQWYFRVVAVDSSAIAGTVAWRHDVYVNDRPHVVASSSHADPDKWYPGKAIALSWTPPSPATADSFPAFWYRLDRDSDTSPANAKTEWTRTTNPQVVLTADASGAPIDSFAYHFHLVAEDTMGNLTRAAAHFRVQVGPEPARMNFFGYVKDSGGNAVSGVTVRLEPYGHQAATDQNGYFILNQIYEGPYVLTARKAGYSDATAAVTVKSDAVPFNVTISAQ